MFFVLKIWIFLFTPPLFLRNIAGF
jgi:hypothetical protein